MDEAQRLPERFRTAPHDFPAPFLIALRRLSTDETLGDAATRTLREWFPAGPER
jgi:hypothetical protein